MRYCHFFQIIFGGVKLAEGWPGFMGEFRGNSVGDLVGERAAMRGLVHPKGHGTGLNGASIVEGKFR
jgi:hypothetical protein